MSSVCDLSYQLGLIKGREHEREDVLEYITKLLASTPYEIDLLILASHIKAGYHLE